MRLLWTEVPKEKTLTWKAFLSGLFFPKYSLNRKKKKNNALKSSFERNANWVNKQN